MYSERAKERVGGDREKKRYLAKKIHTVHRIKIHEPMRQHYFTSSKKANTSQSIIKSYTHLFALL